MEGQIKAGNSAENGSGDASNQSPLNAQEVDVELLPLVHDIIRVLEKDCSDVSQRSRDSLEASQKIIELNKKVEKVREDIYRLPGIEVSKELI